MLKYLLFASLVGTVLAEPIDTQTEIIIVASVLGGVCLLLTIAAIFNSVSIISLQSKVAVLQSASAAAAKTVTEMPSPAGRSEPVKTNPMVENPYAADPTGRSPTSRTRNHYESDYDRHDRPRESRMGGRDDFNRQTRHDDPYRRPRDNYRMERVDEDRISEYSYGNNYRRNNQYPSGPNPPPRPSRGDAGYY